MNNTHKTDAKILNFPERRNPAKWPSFALAAIALAGVFAYAENSKNNTEHLGRVMALQAVDKVGSPIILPSGTELRSTPKELNASDASADVDIDNHAGTVPEGKKWSVKAPLIDSEHPGWVAFTQPSADQQVNKLDDRADRTVWVNYDDITGKNNVLSCKIGQDGAVRVNDKVNPEIGTATEIPVN